MRSLSSSPSCRAGVTEISRILLVEDEADLAWSLRLGLQDEHHAVDVELDGRAGLLAALSEPYDVVILDWMLPGLSGLEVCRRLRDRETTARVLMLTARDTVADTVRALDAGADDYLTKPFAFAELLARIRALLRRERPAAGILQVGDVVLDPAACQVTRAGARISLTATEYRLLEALLRSAGRVRSREQLAGAVWDRSHELGSNAIEVHIAALRRKLGGGRIIHTVRGLGYVAREAED